MDNLLSIQNDLDRNRILECGVAMNDYIQFIPFCGKTRKIQITRTKLNFYSEEIYKKKRSAFDFVIPHLDGQELSYTMKLSGCYKNLENARFYLQSNNEIPFKVNGLVCYKAFIEKGDIVSFGLNQLRFLKEEQMKNDQSNIDLDRIVNSGLDIIIQGETGTGKTRLAKKFHEMSGVNGKFVHINLSSFSKNLIESELFGHVKGAFTGANNDKKGAFLEAHNGTLFLDEIDSLPLEIQTKILLFLDSKEVRPVGGSDVQKTNARLVFASGRSLETLVTEKIMRKDFYFRLMSGYKIELPKLRENTQLIESFCRDYSLEYDLNISQDLVAFYKSYDWPGNYRQLKSHLEKKKALKKYGRIEYDILDETLINIKEDYLNEEEGTILSLDQVKRRYAQKIYHRTQGRINYGASLLQISKTTYKNLIKECS